MTNLITECILHSHMTELMGNDLEHCQTILLYVMAIHLLHTTLP